MTLLWLVDLSLQGTGVTMWLVDLFQKPLDSKNKFEGDCSMSYHSHNLSISNTSHIVKCVCVYIYVCWKDRVQRINSDSDMDSIWPCEKVSTSSLVVLLFIKEKPNAYISHFLFHYAGYAGLLVRKRSKSDYISWLKLLTTICFGFCS